MFFNSNNSSSELSADKKWSEFPSDDVIKILKTSVLGISEEESKKRIKTYGKNVIESKEKFVLFHRFFRITRDPIVLILCTSAIAVYFIGEHLDALIIFITLVLNFIIAFIQEGRVSKVFDLLQSKDKSLVQVKREGVVTQIISEKVVPGDIIILQVGSKVPADLRIISETNLQINESVLTGEWAPVKKQSITLLNPKPIIEQINMAWKGTSVVSGLAEGVVVNTGKHSRLGKISEHLYDKEPKTPLQKQVSDVALLILILISISIFIIFVIAIFKDISLYETVLISVAIAIAGIPSGLPAAITIVLALGMQVIFKNKGLVRNILAAETLGSTTWILTDKTGTLTNGNMKLVNIIYPNSTESVDEQTISAFGRSIVFGAYSATDGGKIVKKGNDEGTFVGTSIDQALVRACESVCSIPLGRESRVAYLPFNSMRRYSAGLIKSQTGKYNYFVVGAPEIILKESSKVYNDGNTSALTARELKKLNETLEKEGRLGRRVIGIGMCTHPEVHNFDENKQYTEEEISFLEPSSQDITFVAFLSLSDTIREDVPESVEFIRNAHIMLTVVTGDNKHTALQVAKESGIVSEKDLEEVIEGYDLEKLTDEELFAKAQHIKVFARMLPDQKSRLLKVLLNRGEVVAMTGDGVNDAPSLHRASIGVAVASGTDVAKEASDLILLENSFSTITKTIVIGRNIIINLKKIIIYLLSTSFSEAILVGGALLTVGVLPITPIQILWANIVEEAFIAFAFAFEKGDSESSMKNPRDERTNNILSKNVKNAIILLTIFIGVFLITVFVSLNSFTSLSESQIQTIMFLVVSIDSIFLAFSLKRLDKSILKSNLFDNKWLIYSVLISLLLLISAFLLPQAREILSLVSVPVSIIIIVGLISAAYHILVIEGIKNFLFKQDYVSVEEKIL